MLKIVVALHVFSDLVVQISWHAQHFVNDKVQILWTQYFVDLEVWILWQAQCFVDLEVQIIRREPGPGVQTCALCALICFSHAHALCSVCIKHSFGIFLG